MTTATARRTPRATDPAVVKALDEFEADFRRAIRAPLRGLIRSLESAGAIEGSRADPVR